MATKRIILIAYLVKEVERLKHDVNLIYDVHEENYPIKVL